MRQTGQVRLASVPLSWKAAVAFVNQYHRHHPGARGQKWATGAVDESGELRAVLQAGRPIARNYDDGFTLEVNRTCTDGVANGNSFLYSLAWRIGREMGYRTAITYIEEGESGVSLASAGWRFVRKVPPRANWAQSSVKLRHKRNAEARSHVGRELWAISRDSWPEVLKRFKVKEEKNAY